MPCAEGSRGRYCCLRCHVATPYWTPRSCWTSRLCTNQPWPTLGHKIWMVVTPGKWLSMVLDIQYLLMVSTLNGGKHWHAGMVRFLSFFFLLWQTLMDISLHTICLNVMSRLHKYEYMSSIILYSYSSQYWAQCRKVADCDISQAAVGSRPAAISLTGRDYEKSAPLLRFCACVHISHYSVWLKLADAKQPCRSQRPVAYAWSEPTTGSLNCFFCSCSHNFPHSNKC